MKLTTDQISRLRTQFPALGRRVHDLPAVYFDGAAGTQVPQRVIDAISEYLVRHNANHEAAGMITASAVTSSTGSHSLAEVTAR